MARMAASPEGLDMKKIALFNHKGGVGKMTLTINVADALADMGKTVLLLMLIRSAT